MVWIKHTGKTGKRRPDIPAQLLPNVPPQYLKAPYPDAGGAENKRAAKAKQLTATEAGAKGRQLKQPGCSVLGRCQKKLHNPAEKQKHRQLPGTDCRFSFQVIASFFTEFPCQEDFGFSAFCGPAFSIRPAAVHPASRTSETEILEPCWGFRKH